MSTDRHSAFAARQDFGVRMFESRSGTSVLEGALDAASASAVAAAETTDVEIRPLRLLSEFMDCERLFARVWKPGDGGVPLTSELLRGIASADNYVVGAFADSTLLGACVAFWGLQRVTSCTVISPASTAERVVVPSGTR
ncbi:hypothetical protein [Microbacterium sp. NIBRBAC000506063]|uniref:hypothetical protein n=1 Tax=Microbacterium sp. NIBRBAC000506063 TaxID=2734618 RepID=UPI001BB6F70F|nr:hypothetical protein [Microbacterium sp. NIBRBAC000506063]QTV79599.1 hypothetical protein KAE78_12250 [Microbacterium sp. NIBRBAC000506063]